MKKDRKWTATAAGKMTLVYVTTAVVVVFTIVGCAMIIKNLVLQLLLTAAGLAVFWVISSVFGRYITNQISKVEKRLENISDGDVHTFTDKLEEKTEFDELYNTLEDTVIHLNNVINEINKGLDEVAAGNLNYRLPSTWKGDFGLISRKYNDITISLRQTFRNINNASDQVSSGSQQVADGAQTLSQGATEQAASIEQLTSQIHTISDRVQNTAASAGKAMQVVNDTGDKIRECGKEMKQMLSAMDEINNSSAEISKIIKVIDDIAFQTNILALNAAVEAARAGAAGKGFAVVADEVRNLAAKSAEAAKQTTSLIENSIESVKKGAAIAQETAGTLDEIITNSGIIVTEVATISDASNEQADEIKRVSVGVEQIAAVVQSNTATAEESAATSEELSGQSGILRGLLSHFKINDDPSGDYRSEEQSYSYSDSYSDTYPDTDADSGSSSDYSNVFDYYVNGNDSGAFEEPASDINPDDSFVPVDFSDMDSKPSGSKPPHIYLDDDFENVQSKY
ncbi:MAG: methyl-accepting chemotaxis protein [Oscillospiraceae bacterium]|nr:methyl-accepting chemotaxis protein [Oscillospiraceae bacterium]